MWLGLRAVPPRSLRAGIGWAQCELRPRRRGLQCPGISCSNEGELFQSLTINGKHLVTYVITEEDDPDPVKTRSRYEVAGF